MKTLILIFAPLVLLMGVANAVENSNTNTRRVAYTWSDKDKASNRTKAEYLSYVFDKQKPAYMEKFGYPNVSEKIILASVVSGANRCEQALIARLNQINAAHEFCLTDGNNEIIDFTKALEIMKGSYEKALDPSKTYVMDGMAIDAITGKPVGVSQVIRKPHRLIDGPEKGLFIKLPDGSDEFIASLFCFNINAAKLVKTEVVAAAPMMDFQSSEEVAEAPVETPVTLKKAYRPAQPQEIATVSAPAVKAGCWDVNPTNGLQDPAEDRNHDNRWNDDDCDVADRGNRTVGGTGDNRFTIAEMLAMKQLFADDKQCCPTTPTTPVQPVAPQPAVTWYQPAMNPQPYYPPQQNIGGGFWNNPYALGWGNLAVNTGFGIWDRIAPYLNQNNVYCGIPQENPWRGNNPIDRPIDRTPVDFTPQMWDPVTVNGGGNNNNNFNPNMYGTVRPNR